uniref:Putative secreted protein n=1 Tax=Ixodes ricinus TaxID=34613 RepID=A0A6B0TZE0_IXORI
MACCRGGGLPFLLGTSSSSLTPILSSAVSHVILWHRRARSVTRFRNDSRTLRGWRKVIGITESTVPLFPSSHDLRHTRRNKNKETQ